MSKRTVKYLAISLCAALCAGCIGITAYALNNETKEPVNTTAPASSNLEENKENSKDETVYVLAGADGSVNKIIVSDWIKNALGSASISDQSELSNIENVKGDETYSMNGEHMKVWDAMGNDIYYQGNIEKELPVGLSVSYKLDGKAISASDLAGKSGKVTIRFDYDNRQYKTVSIDGKEEKMYVPFAMLTGMLLDNDTFRNVEVTNGKLINDGSRMAVIGIAFPGLQENLALDKEKLEIPDYVEITADADHFSLGITITVATNEIFNKIDTDKLHSVDGLTGSLGELTAAMDQLINGSSTLYNGLNTLLDKSDTLVSGINKLALGAKELQNGTTELDNGAAKLQSGITELHNGLSQLSANNDTLNDGAKQVFDSLLSTANTQIAAAGLAIPALTIENYSNVLNDVILSLDETAVYDQALQTVTAAVEANRPMITAKVTEAVKEQVVKQVTAAVAEQVTMQVQAAVRDQVAEQVISAATNGQMTKESYDAAVAANMIDAATQEAIEKAIDGQMEAADIKMTIDANITEQMASAKIQGLIDANTADQMKTESVQKTIADNVELQVKQAISENMASAAVQDKLKAASEGAASIISLKASLDSYNSFYLGLRTYTDGVASAASGASELDTGAAALKSGTAELLAGVNELCNGALQMKDGTPALVDGITQLKDGALQLSDGLKKFNEDGIEKLIEAVDGDLEGMVTRLRATIDVSKNYKNFAGINEDMDGQVKFIYRTDSIDADTEN